MEEFSTREKREWIDLNTIEEKRNGITISIVFFV